MVGVVVAVVAAAAGTPQIVVGNGLAVAAVTGRGCGRREQRGSGIKRAA